MVVILNDMPLLIKTCQYMNYEWAEHKKISVIIFRFEKEYPEKNIYDFLNILFVECLIYFDYENYFRLFQI